MFEGVQKRSIKTWF